VTLSCCVGLKGRKAFRLDLTLACGKRNDACLRGVGQWVKKRGSELRAS